MTDQKSKGISTEQQSDVSNSSNSRLSRDETMDIFRKMANSKPLRIRNVDAYKLFGQGVWLIQAKSAAQLKNFDGSRSIYVPMTSLGMFFVNPVIMKEKIDPTREILLAATYLIPGDNTLSYIWTKATISQDTQPVMKKELVPVSKVTIPISPTPVQPVKHPRVNLPSVVNGSGGKGNFQIKPRPVKRSGAVVTGTPVISTVKKSTGKKPK